ncbi:MAG: phosphotransferase [Propionicimonas sp.]
MDAEKPLAGGNMGPVSRRGDEVLRTAGPWTANVHRLLGLYDRAGVTGTPRPLGFTDDGRERLSFLPGTVPAYPMPDWVWDEAVLDDAAHLLRRLHDASRPLAGIAEGWRSPVRVPAEVVCHNDFAPYNLVFDNGWLTGVIDFDYCSPGPRIWDLAYLGYTLVPLTGALGVGPFTAGERADRLVRLLAAYGSSASVEELVSTLVVRLRDLADFSDRACVELGNPELARHASGYREDAARVAAGSLVP